MAALIKPGQVKIVTQDGEIQVSIVLELNINLNSDGLITASPEVKAVESLKVKNTKKEETDWMIPDFESQKINFGKRE